MRVPSPRMPFRPSRAATITPDAAVVTVVAVAIGAVAAADARSVGSAATSLIVSPHRTKPRRAASQACLRSRFMMLLLPHPPARFVAHLPASGPSVAPRLALARHTGAGAAGGRAAGAAGAARRAVGEAAGAARQGAPEAAVHLLDGALDADGLSHAADRRGRNSHLGRVDDDDLERGAAA